MYPHPTTLLAEGMLEVTDGQRLHYWAAGNPAGRPVVALHGGPGSGCSPAWARFADPDVHLIVGFDQRGCGQSTPDAGDPGTDLSTNTTRHLVQDVEALRRRLGIASWTVLAGSWGSILGLAYAQEFPERVDAMVLFSVVGPGREQLRWVLRDIGRIFPEAWDRFREAVPENLRDGDLIEAYAHLLADDDPAVRAAAAKAWCDWEDTHVSLGAGHDERYDDPAFRYRFARLVTHYWRHAHFLDDGQQMRDLGRLHGIPAVLIQGRLDVSGPPDVAWKLARAWPGCRFVVCEGGSHGAGTPSMGEAIVESLSDLTRPLRRVEPDPRPVRDDLSVDPPHPGVDGYRDRVPAPAPPDQAAPGL